jgi:molybdopterin-guanine dinucleotide biosynthesis protein B
MKLIGLAGWSGAGKTTLLMRVIPLLIARGLKVSTIKHAHHSFDVDVPGKDSHRHREAGATEVLVSSGKRFALMHELREEAEWPLADLLHKMSPVDLLIIEGFKRDNHPKIEVHRAENGKPHLFPEDRTIVALASDMRPDTHLPLIHIDDAERIAATMIEKAVPLSDVLGG